jgi:NADH dehydrogenase [ubiquinone] 1 alpha subcomplex assembly factor 7
MDQGANLAERLAHSIAAAGPISVAQFMEAANAHYYASRDPLGLAGDFTTAPEITQMFGEMVGIWLADLWLRSGQLPCHYVELGPGRGTLATDALRTMSRFGLAPTVHFVETSPVLRHIQAKHVPAAVWHDSVSTLPNDGPLLIVANEFFDALPIHQMIKTGEGWCERFVTVSDGLFFPVPAVAVQQGIIPEHLRDAPAGSIIETGGASVMAAQELCDRLVRQGGVALIIDYGYEGPSVGETLQAVKGHRYANPFDNPGEQDMTAHVDFAALGAVAEWAGAVTFGPVGQGVWLEAVGINPRAEALKASAPERSHEIDVAVLRLTSDGAMGRLFQAFVIQSPKWPEPAGFA